MIAIRKPPGSELHRSDANGVHSSIKQRLRFFSQLSCLALSLLSLNAAELDSPQAKSTNSAQDPATAMRLFHAAPGFKIDLFAAEPMVQNIVSFTFDEQGHCYVVESNRRRTSVLDIRNFPEWLESDFAIRTVEQRADFFRRTLTPTNQAQLDKLSRVKRGFLPDLNADGIMDWRDLEVESERIRLLVDTNADGHADVATTFAEGFNGITSGVAAGVLARQGNVWFTCIPDLWRLAVNDLGSTKGLPTPDALPINPHRANSQSKIENLIHGFGTHIAIGGHDLHGLKMGPDGKIYFSIADRGTSTNLWDRIIDHWPGLTLEALADSGAVFRCEPDGTQLEVVAIGLRNPQELGFDELGNLFTGDNNGDGGDKSRWEYILEGADYGWRIGWQWLPKMGAWNSEMLWGMASSNSSSYHPPPVTHIAAGPAGLAYYPGTGLPARYDRHFFLCDFRGGPNSLVYSFALRPKGAGFEAYDESEFIRGFLCTDVDFGLDGAVYISDWVKGWEKTGQGRIWRVFDPVLVNDPAMLEVKKLMNDGMKKRPDEELARLLGHRDMRVRLEAQWEFANRATTNTRAYERLTAAAEKGPTISRLHAIWGLGQIARAGSTSGTKSRMGAAAAQLKLTRLAADADPEIAAQATKLLSETNQAGVWVPERVLDQNPRVQLLALRGLAKAATLVPPAKRNDFNKAALPALFDVLRRNNDQDAYIRHAAVFALARIGDVSGLVAASRDSSPAVRMGVCLALRRLQRPEVAQLLNDPEPKIVLEAARAINDVPIPEATVALAQKLPAAVWRAEYHDTNMFAPVLRRAMNAHYRLGRKENASALALFAANENAPEMLRAEAVELLSLWPKPPGRDHVVGLWRPLPPRDGDVATHELASILPKIETNGPAIVKLAARKAATQLASGTGTAPTIGPEEFAKLSRTLENGTIPEKQNALSLLGSMNDERSAQPLTGWLDKLLAGEVPKELRLDVLEAARKNQSLLASDPVKEKLKKYEAAHDSHDALAKWRDCLYGGNAEEGKKVFFERQDAACLRCHKINGEGGEVGPDLAGVGQKQTRDYILESVILPNAKISPGFDTVLVWMKNGSSSAGIVKSENDNQLIINSPEDGLVTIKKADIEKRNRGLSAMPDGMGDLLSKQELRNLIEFLATTPQHSSGSASKR